MSQKETILKVPASDVARVKAEYEADGATVVVTPNGDGTSKIVATYPRRETVDGVPDSDVARVKGEYEADGAAVVVTSNGDGTSKVVATYTDSTEM
jgi:hypothetical protein